MRPDLRPLQPDKRVWQLGDLALQVYGAADSGGETRRQTSSARHLRRSSAGRVIRAPDLVTLSLPSSNSTFSQPF